MPLELGLRTSSCLHNAFYAVDCQGLSGIGGKKQPFFAG